MPRDVFIAAVHPKLHKPQGRDLVALQVHGVRARRAASRRRSSFRLIDYYDAEHGISAMMRTTGYSLSITGQMQADGRVTREGRPHPRRGDAVPRPTWRSWAGGVSGSRNSRPTGRCSGCHDDDSTSGRCGRGALTFEAFVAASDKHKGLWEGIYRHRAAARVGAASAVPAGTRRRLLVIAEDWCGDASSTVPILARLADSAAGARAPGPAARRASRGDGPLSHQRLALHPDRDRAGRGVPASWATGGPVRRAAGLGDEQPADRPQGRAVSPGPALVRAGPRGERRCGRCWRRPGSGDRRAWPRAARTSSRSPPRN